MSTIQSSNEHLTINASGAGKELRLQNNGTTNVTVASDGNVGIGTSSPASPSHTKGTSSTGFYGNVLSTFEDSSGNHPALAFKGTNGHLFGMRCEGGESMTFATTPSGTSWNPVMRMDADGLKFNGDTSASNALDDYEEGTFTAVVTMGSGSAPVDSSNDTLSYTKIGRQVTVGGQFRLSGVSSPSGSMRLSLPFIVGGFGEGSGLSCGTFRTYLVDIPNDAVSPAIYADPGTSAAQIQWSRDNADSTNGLATSNGYYLIGLTYFTN